MPGVSDPKFLFLGEQAWRAAPTDGALWVEPEGRLQLMPLPAPAAGITLPGGLTSSRGDRYVVDATKHQVLVYARDHHQLVDVWEGFQTPHSVAVSPDGSRVYVTDKTGLNVLDPRTGERLGQVGALTAPTGLWVTPEGSLYVTDSGHVVAFDPDSTELLRFDTGGAPTVVTAGPHFIWTAGEAHGGIQQYTRSGVPVGSSTYISTVRDLRYVADGLLVAIGADQPEPLLLAASGAYTRLGQFISQPLDSKLHDCQWHKLVLGAKVPFGAVLTVETRTSPVPLTQSEVTGGEWSHPVRFTSDLRGELDLAVLSPPGRYLWLRITLEGDGTATPELAWLRAYYPRSTYADYLPAVFRSDPVSADFLDRYLLLFEHFLEDWEQKVDHMADLFSPEASPHLPALASWLEFPLNGRQPEGQQRQWLGRAMAMHHRRGTVEGLRDFLRMYTDPDKPPVVVEGFVRRGFTRLGGSGEGARLGVDTVLPGAPETELVLGAEALGNGDLLTMGPGPVATGVHQFTVFAYQYPGQPTDEPAVLDRVVEQERPAHTLHTLCEVRPAMRIGAQAVIGVDTVLAGDYPPPLPGPGQLPTTGPIPTELRPHAPVLDRGNRLR